MKEKPMATITIKDIAMWGLFDLYILYTLQTLPLKKVIEITKIISLIRSIICTNLSGIFP